MQFCSLIARLFSSPRRPNFLSLTLALAMGLSIGCGSQPEVKLEDRLLQDVGGEEKEKIRAILKKANINGEIVSIEKGGDLWSVDVSTSLSADGKRRGGGMMPKNYAIDMTKGEIVDLSGKKKSGTAKQPSKQPAAKFKRGGGAGQ